LWLWNQGIALFYIAFGTLFKTDIPSDAWTHTCFGLGCDEASLSDSPVYFKPSGAISSEGEFIRSAVNN